MAMIRVYTNSQDVVIGLEYSETIYAYDGADVIYAGLGHDYIYAGAGNDIILAQSNTSGVRTAWGYDTVEGGSGDDSIHYNMTTSDVVLYGDDPHTREPQGNDFIQSGSGQDLLVGGGGHDTIWGGAGNDAIYGDQTLHIQGGNDRLYGEAGSDQIRAGFGHDFISGGTGRDFLWGSQGSDKFAYEFGNSGMTYAGADVINDFDRVDDWLDMPRAGTAANYREISVSNPGGTEAAFEYARKAAVPLLSTVDYVFVTNGTNGYMFADLNRNSYLDTGITMLGLNSLHDFQYSDII